MAKLKIIARQNTPLSNGNYPIAFRLAHLKQPATHIRIAGMSVSNISEWNMELCRFSSKKKSYKALNKKLTELEEKGESILEFLLLKDRFSYDTFKAKINGKKGVEECVVDAFKTKINELKQSKKQSNQGTALFYSDSLQAFKEVIGNKRIVFSDVNYTFLKDFEKKRREKGNSGTTIAIYLRGLRALHYEYCKQSEILQPDCYIRFNINRLIKPTKKRALTKEQLKALISYQPINKYEQRTKDIFLFSFYANGINLMDIAQLKKRSIVNNRIEYTRSKTGGVFSLLITKPVKEIIDRYSNDSEYLFPIVKRGNSVKSDVRMFNSTLNRILKRISKKIGLPYEVSIYWARHSFSQQARESGFSIDIISQLLGHSNTEITKTYLSGFSNSELDSVTDDILKSL